MHVRGPSLNYLGVKKQNQLRGARTWAESEQPRREDKGGAHIPSEAREVRQFIKERQAGGAAKETEHLDQEVEVARSFATQAQRKTRHFIDTVQRHRQFQRMKNTQNEGTPSSLNTGERTHRWAPPPRRPESDDAMCSSFIRSENTNTNKRYGQCEK